MKTPKDIVKELRILHGQSFPHEIPDAQLVILWITMRAINMVHRNELEPTMALKVIEEAFWLDESQS